MIATGASGVGIGLLAVGAVFASTVLLWAYVPTHIDWKDVQGYVVAGKQPLHYRLNGFRIAVVTAALAAVCHTFPAGRDALAVFVHFPKACAAAGCLYGLLMSAIAFWVGRNSPVEYGLRCMTVDQLKRKAGAPPTPVKLHSPLAKPWLVQFYEGLQFNPRLATCRSGDKPNSNSLLALFDFKMWLYLAGSIQIEITTLAIVSEELTSTSRLSVATLCWAGMMMWFVGDYLLGEFVHLFTYDLFAERLGFKLCWGCLCVFAFFYPVSGWCLLDHAVASGTDLSVPVAAAIWLLFLLGWYLTRGANLQKHAFKLSPKSTRFDFFPFSVTQVAVPGSQNRLLMSGWWGLSRHINYLGEILQGLAISLPGFLLTGSLIPLLYPAYYVMLLVPRQVSDDALCEEKYGERVWTAYKSAVPWRIVPWVW